MLIFLITVYLLYSLGSFVVAQHLFRGADKNNKIKVIILTLLWPFMLGLLHNKKKYY